MYDRSYMNVGRWSDNSGAIPRIRRCGAKPRLLVAVYGESARSRAAPFVLCEVFGMQDRAHSDGLSLFCRLRRRASNYQDGERDTGWMSASGA